MCSIYIYLYCTCTIYIHLINRPSYVYLHIHGSKAWHSEAVSATSGVASLAREDCILHLTIKRQPVQTRFTFIEHLSGSDHGEGTCHPNIDMIHMTLSWCWSTVCDASPRLARFLVSEWLQMAWRHCQFIKHPAHRSVLRLTRVAEVEPMFY